MSPCADDSRERSASCVYEPSAIAEDLNVSAQKQCLKEPGVTHELGEVDRNDISSSKSGASMFLVAKFAEMLGDKFLLFLVPVVVYMATKDVRFSGVVMIVQWSPRIFLQPFLSSAICSIPFKLQIVSVSLAKAAVCVLMAIWSSNLLLVLCAVSVISLLNGFSFVNLESIGGSIKDKGRRALFQAHILTIDRSSRILGPALGGLAIASMKFEYDCLLAAFLFLANFSVLAFRFDLDIATRETNLKSMVLDVWLAIRHISSTPPLYLLLFFMMIGNLLEGMLLTFLPKLVVTTYNAKTTAISYVEVGTALLTIISLHALPRMANGMEQAVNKSFVPALAMMILACGLFAFASNIYIAAIGFAIFFVAQSISTVFIRLHRIEFIPVDRFGATMSVALSVVGVTLPVSGYLIVLLAPTFSSRVIILAGTVLSAACFWFTWNRYARASKMTSTFRV